MAHRSELKGIANALNGSFVSRNNDFRGYWSIGQLKSLAIDMGLTAMVFPLDRSEAAAGYHLQSYMVQHYAGMLERLLIKQHIPGYWVSEAIIMIDFKADAKHAGLNDYSASGEPYCCTCQITDDSGRNYSSIIYGRCLRHSVKHELKSTR
ncbi:hypothetical protein C3408_17180 [Candidatus Pantoea alvi]|uniref:hypothetical protein n=1 Tax=Enterobacter agglomerans TaxID=549 RepID=UPI000CDD997A|nr:hypothetical protein [Pantoea agglomerans]POW55637.1 hypothetical protein C3408_17180 [Pantoea alvi]UBN52277.1 hypothetical protein LB453_01545 [Pantoea agglomerans]